MVRIEEHEIAEVDIERIGKVVLANEDDEVIPPLVGILEELVVGKLVEEGKLVQIGRPGELVNGLIVASEPGLLPAPPGCSAVPPGGRCLYSWLPAP